MLEQVMKTLEYERYKFKLIKQEHNEPLESFYERLRMQARKCQFTDIDSHLKDQIIEKCSSNDLRCEAFECPMSLEQLIFTGKTLESAEKNSQSSRSGNFQRRGSHNSDDTERRSASNDRFSDRRNFNNFRQVPHNQQKLPPCRDRNNECNRCGYNDHKFDSLKCPAMKEQCDYCKKPGHFSRMCWEAKFGRKRPRPDTSFDGPRKQPRFSSTDDNRNQNASNLMSSEKGPRRVSETVTSNTIEPASSPKIQTQISMENVGESSSRSSSSIGKLRIKNIESLSTEITQKFNQANLPNNPTVQE